MRDNFYFNNVLNIGGLIFGRVIFFCVLVSGL